MQAMEWMGLGKKVFSGSLVAYKKGDDCCYMDVEGVEHKIGVFSPAAFWADWRIYEDKKYFILICPICKSQLFEESMGQECPTCGNWTYHPKCKTEVVIK